MDEDERLEAGIDAVLWLASSTRPEAPARLRQRIDELVVPRPAVVPAAPAAPVARAGRAARPDRPGRLVAAVALALCGAFLFQGIGNLVLGDWIAKNLGEPFSGHAYREGAIALVAAAVCAAAGAVRRSWSGVSVLACSPLAVSLGVHGVGEIGVFAAGVALHLAEGVLGLLLVAAWWKDRRDTRAARAEEGA